MKRLLLSLTVLSAMLSASAVETRTLAVSAETLGANPGTVVATKQFLQTEQDGITVTYYGGCSPSEPKYFNMAGNWMTATNGPAFLAVTSNEHQYKITGVELKCNKASTNATMYKYAIATTSDTPVLEVNSGIPVLDKSGWQNVFVSSTLFSVGSQYQSLSTPTPYVCFYNQGSMALSHFYEVVFSYEVEDDIDIPGDKERPEFAFELATYRVEAGEYFMPALLTNIPADSAIKYSSVPTYGMEYDPELKQFQGSEAGEYTISAYFAGDDRFAPASASCKVTVVANSIAPGTVQPVKTVPAMGTKIASFNPISLFTITYPSMGNDGIEAVDRADNVYIRILKDGEVYKKIPTTDRSAFYISNNNYSEINLRIDPISEIGKYTLVIPANILTFDISAGSVVGGDDSTADKTPEQIYQMSHNATLTLNFEIVFEPSYTISPAPGSVTAEELSDVTITYPEGTMLIENSGSILNTTPTLYFIDTTINEGEEITDEDGNGTGVFLHQKKLISTYTVVLEDNKVLLHLDDSSDIATSPANTQVKWYYILIPQGSWTASYEGKDYPVMATTIEKYAVIDEQAGDNNDKPALTIGEKCPVTSDELSVLKLTYPADYTFNEWSASNPMGKKEGFQIGSLRKVETAEATYGTTIGNYTLTNVDTANRVLTLEINNGALQSLSDGIYCVALNTNLFVLPDKSKSSFIYFTGYTYDSNATAVDLIGSDDTEAIWYDLTGNIVAEPARGLYIRLAGGKAEKMILK